MRAINFGFKVHRFLPFTARSLNTQTRFLHSCKGEFITISSDGVSSSRQVDIMLGDSTEAFALIPTEIGKTFKAAQIGLQGLSLTKDSETCPLVFNHSHQHFSLETWSYPRLIIPQNMPNLSTKLTSPATLYLFGVAHTIALNGTADEMFAQLSGETYRRLKPTLDKLKHT